MTIRTALTIWGLGLLVGLTVLPGAVQAGDEAKTADLLIKLLKAGRSVISNNQGLINDRTIGHKGFTSETFQVDTIKRFKKQTSIDLGKVKPSNTNTLLLLLLQSEMEVVDDYQPVINKEGIALKGVLPAVFARKTGEKFYEKTGITIKLTGKDFRFRGNRPDAFEAAVLKKFTAPNYPKGKEYKQYTRVADRRFLRVMAPEYAKASCLKCHGTPQGERDITGGRKEGWKEGDIGGAISVIIPLQEAKKGRR